MILREFDGYPAFFKGRLKSVERPFSRGVLAVIRWVGGWFWLKGWYEEYTPKELISVMEAKKKL